MEEMEEFASPTLASSSSTPSPPVKKKRSRFAIEFPEKILEEALRKEEQEEEVSNVRRATHKAKSAGRRKSRGKYSKEEEERGKELERGTFFLGGKFTKMSFQYSQALPDKF